MNPTLECAEYYISRGWQVLPLHKIKDGRCTCGKADCSSPGKHPAVLTGTKEASTDPDQIKTWFADESRNIGICAGEISKLVVLDIDPAHGGTESLADLRTPPPTLECLTGGNGRHLYFTHPGGDVRNSAGTVGKGLDVRGHHGYVVAPPSNHISGGTYRWKLDPRSVDVAACPSWVLGSGKKRTDKTTEGKIPIGEHNVALTSLAGSMRRAGASEDMIYAALLIFNRNRCEPPGHPDDKIRKIAKSVSNYESENKNKIVLADDRPTTIAIKFENLSKVSHRYNSIDEWSIYSNNQYQRVPDDKEIETHILRFLSKCVVTKHKKEGDGWKEYTEKLKKQSGGFVRDIMRALRSMKTVHILPSMKAPSSFNGALNPETTLAMDNGLLDLSDMQNPKMTAFTPNFYTFNYLPIKYDPDAECPLWEDPCMGFYFTDDDGKPDTIALDVLYSWQKRFILRIVNPHKIFAIIGDPRSGKSTMGRIIQAIVGAKNCTALTIASLSGPHGMHSLMNKQLGIMWDAQVSGRNQDIVRAVQAMKTISGQDPIQVNPKGRDTIELNSLPLNILMIANEPANLKDSTGVLATRFTFLKTTQSFLGHEDPSIEVRIMEHELPGIFNKILAAPNTIIEHPKSASMVQDYAEMTSPYTAFANDCCVKDPDYFIPTDILWAYYCVWCDKFNHRKPSAQTFKINLRSQVKPQVKPARWSGTQN